MEFFSSEAALYLYRSTIRPCMEYRCHVWAGVLRCYLQLLDKLQKRICRTVGSSLAASLKPLAHRQNVASSSVSCRYQFGRCSSELVELVPLPYYPGRSTCYILIDCVIFLSPFLNVSLLARLDSGILCLSNAFLGSQWF